MNYDKDGEYRIVEPRYSASYSIGPHDYSPRVKRPLTSPAEIRDILVALVALTLAFYLIIYTPGGRGVLFFVGISVIVVVAGFFVHEMSHKAVARRYGCWAEFRADYRMLGLMLLMSFFGFLFAAPGAVMIAGNIDREQNGKISLAGPGSNIIVAALSLPFALSIFSGIPSILHDAAAYLTYLSGFLGAFNMIPVMPFDGSKIWHWNKAAYAAALLAAALLAFLGYTAFASL